MSSVAWKRTSSEAWSTRRRRWAKEWILRRHQQGHEVEKHALWLPPWLRDGFEEERSATPRFEVHADRLVQNCERMLSYVVENQLGFRPHVKTHKTIELALFQLWGKAAFSLLQLAMASISKKTGKEEKEIDEKAFEEFWSYFTQLESLRPSQITVSTFGEAYFFGYSGLFSEILLAVPLAGKKKIRQAERMMQMIPRFCILIDQLEMIPLLPKPWTLSSTKESDGEKSVPSWRIFVKVDTGYHRAGRDVSLCYEICKSILTSSHMQLMGLYSHCGHSYGVSSLPMMKDIITTDYQVLDILVKRLEEGKFDSLNSLVISVGSTPSCSTSCTLKKQPLGCVNEIHPGNYCLYDMMQFQMKSCSFSDIAGRVVGTILSHYPERKTMLCDVGALALSKDRENPQAVDRTRIDAKQKSYSWAMVVGYEDVLSLIRISQEEGVIRISEHLPEEKVKALYHQLPIGSEINFYPYHACLTAGCFDSLFLQKSSCLPTLKEDDEVDCSFLSFPLKTSPRIW